MPISVSAFDAAFEADRVRLSALFFPAAGITYEQFSKYWLHEHGRLFMSLDIVKKNLTKYEQVRISPWTRVRRYFYPAKIICQFHVNPELSHHIAAAMGSPEKTPFWGLVTFEAESYEKINEVLNHPEYLRVVFPDEQKILDRSKSVILAGEYATFLRS